MAIDGTIFVSPTEPVVLREREGWTTSSLPERNGVDMYWSAGGKLWGVQRKEMCVSPDTKVLTSDLRWVSAGTVSTDDELMGFDEFPVNKYGRRHWRKAQVVSSKRVRLPGFLLTFDDGTEVICSGQHRWLTRRSREYEWTATHDLSPAPEGGNRRGIRHHELVRVAHPWKVSKTWDHGYLAGAFDGEGHLQQRDSKGNGNAMSLVLAQADNAMWPQVLKSLTSLGFSYRESQRNRARQGWKDINVVHVAPRQEIMRLLGEVRPQRLLDNFDPNRMGQIYPKPKYQNPKLISKTSLGETDLIALTTDCRTFVAEGLASHNSDLIASRGDGRLEVELGQMKALDVAVLVVEGKLRWTSEGELMDDWMQLSKSQLRGMLWTIRDRGCWVEYTTSLNETAELVEMLMSWSQKRRHTGLRGRPGPPSNWGYVSDRDWAIHLLTSFKGIGPGVAAAIYDHFDGIPLTWEVGVEELVKVAGVGKMRANALVAALDDGRDER